MRTTAIILLCAVVAVLTVQGAVPSTKQNSLQPSTPFMRLAEKSKQTPEQLAAMQQQQAQIQASYQAALAGATGANTANPTPATPPFPSVASSTGSSSTILPVPAPIVPAVVDRPINPVQTGNQILNGQLKEVTQAAQAVAAYNAAQQAAQVANQAVAAAGAQVASLPPQNVAVAQALQPQQIQTVNGVPVIAPAAGLPVVNPLNPLQPAVAVQTIPNPLNPSQPLVVPVAPVQPLVPGQPIVPAAGIPFNPLTPQPVVPVQPQQQFGRDQQQNNPNSMFYVPPVPSSTGPAFVAVAGTPESLKVGNAVFNAVAGTANATAVIVSGDTSRPSAALFKVEVQSTTAPEWKGAISSTAAPARQDVYGITVNEQGIPVQKPDVVYRLDSPLHPAEHQKLKDAHDGLYLPNSLEILNKHETNEAVRTINNADKLHQDIYDRDWANSNVLIQLDAKN